MKNLTLFFVSNGYKLYLDDFRNPRSSYEETKLDIYLKDWVVVRSYNQFIERIELAGLPDVVSFDHDLATEHIDYFFMNGGHINPPDPLKANFEEKTGYDCAIWLRNYCKSRNLKFPEYLIHSHNPVGAKNIQSICIQ